MKQWFDSTREHQGPKMNILYIHGFGSAYNPDHPKIKELTALGEVYGVDVDYTKGHEHVFNKVYDTVTNELTDASTDLVIGTSMGGYMAAAIGSSLDIPFVAMNPVIEPKLSLLQWVGTFINYNRDEKHLSRSIVAMYPSISKKGNGLILLDLADEILPARETEDELKDVFQVETFAGGGHRFTHTKQSIPIIKEFIENTNGKTSDP